MTLIKLPYGGEKVLAQKFNVSVRTVYNALTGRTKKSPLSNSLRKAALENGGTLYIRQEPHTKQDQ